MLKLHNISKKEPIIVTSPFMKLDSAQHCHTWGKGKMEGDEISRAQWIIHNFKNQTVTRNTINNIKE